MRRTIRAVASSLALGAALSSCGGDPEPRFEAEPSAEPATSSPSASAEPEPWEERTPEGAVAFAKYWTATFSEAFQTGDTEAFERLNAADCESCGFLVETVESIYGVGGTAVGDDWKLTEPASSPPRENGEAITVTGLMLVSELTVRRPGQPVTRDAAERVRFNFDLRWDGGWKVERLVQQA